MHESLIEGGAILGVVLPLPPDWFCASYPLTHNLLCMASTLRSTPPAYTSLLLKSVI
jgi:hypothetical protein